MAGVPMTLCVAHEVAVGQSVAILTNKMQGRLET